MLITKDYFSKTPKLKIEKVKLTDKKEIYVREVTGNEYAKAQLAGSPDGEKWDSNKFQNALIGVSICDADGVRILGDDELNKVGDCFNEPDIILLYLAARKLNRLDEDIEALAGK